MGGPDEAALAPTAAQNEETCSHSDDHDSPQSAHHGVEMDLEDVYAGGVVDDLPLAVDDLRMRWSHVEPGKKNEK